MKCCVLLLAISLGAAELRFALHNEPATLDPWLAADESAVALRYLTEGVLIRINRFTQKPEPELAASWTVSLDRRTITFQLRKGVTFADGTPFTSRDVVETFRKLLDPGLKSPVADMFRSDRGAPRISALGTHVVVAAFPAPSVAFEWLFDEVAIVPANAEKRPAAGLGPFQISARSPGSSITLQRNPRYWKQKLPLVDTLRLEIQQNRDLELLRLRRGELHLIDNLTPDLFERLTKEGSALDAGPSLDVEFLWFNMAQRAPVAAHKKVWFQMQGFRRAVSEAIRRADLVRLVYHGRATPAAGLISPANRLWFADGLQPDAFNAASARKRLAADGFVLRGSQLYDREGNAVEFSIITNAGSKTRERMAALIRQDLAELGMKIHIVPFEFPSLIERITRTLDYEMCLLGFVNVSVDPNGLMNVLLSSARNHAWNPAQKAPETAWEAEIDRHMLAQASNPNPGVRKKHYSRVQIILREQSPMLFLLHPHALAAASKQVKGVKVTPFFPRTFWNAETLLVSE